MLVSAVQWLSSETVTSLVVGVGVPACGFLIAYAAAVRWRAKRHGVGPGTPSYLLAASAGVVISLSGQVAALQLASIAAERASSGYYYDDTLATTYLGVSLLWPVAWCLLAVVILVAARRRLGPPARSVVAAVAVGLLVSLLTFVAQFGFGDTLPVGLRVPFVLALLAAAIVLLVTAPRGSRDPGPGRAAG